MKWLGIVAVIIVAAVVIYRIAYPSATVRYRVTLEAEVDGDVRSGFGIIEVSYIRNLRFLGASAEFVTDVRGEAVSIAVGKNALILALLDGGDHPRSAPEYIIPILFGITSGGIGSADFQRISKLSGRRDIPSELMPPMIILRNRADPKSAELIGRNDVGPSPRAIRLVGAFIEIVDAGYWPLNLAGLSGVPVTHKLGNELPWLNDKSSINLFWRSLYTAGFRPNGTIEPMMLLIRGG